jgi:hypothetical protein
MTSMFMKRKLNPSHIFTWCVAHRFNLVMDDGIKKCKPISDLLSSLNLFANYMRRSPKRIKNWKEIVHALSKKYGDINKRIMPQKNNSTRWWSRFKCLKHTCKTISCIVAFLVSLKQLYISTLGRSTWTNSQKSAIKGLHDAWTEDSQNIILAHSFKPILEELHISHVKLQSFPLPVSDMLIIIEKCDLYLQNLERDEVITQIIEDGCTFGKDVLDRLLTEEVKQILSDHDGDGGDDNIYNLEISTTQKKFIKDTLTVFVKEIRKGLDKRFLKNFAKFKQYYSELNALSPFCILRMHRNTQIKFRYMPEYNNFEQSEFESEFKLFVKEFQEYATEGKKSVLFCLTGQVNIACYCYLPMFSLFHQKFFY